MATLFDDDVSDEDGNLNINKDYAVRYTQWREKEEYQKLKDKYGEDTANRLVSKDGGDDDESSSESETEDEDGEAWDSEVEKQFFQTLASLKKKDPSLYSSDQQFFDKSKQPVVKKKGEKEQAFTLRDYERKLIVEKGGRMSEDEDTAGPSQTFTEEQEQLKKGFKKILNDSDSEGDDLLKVRPKTSEEKVKEEEEYKEWLKGRKNDISSTEVRNKLKPLKEYWSDPKLDENEKFLKDFFLNKRYKDTEDKDYIPTYDEVVHDSEGDLSEDEKTLEHQNEFEKKYNFRFEEPDQEFIKRYPRAIPDSLRRPDTSRKQKRDAIKERKQQEKEEKKEELKMLKKYKLKEIQEKLEKLKSITGNPSLPFQDQDLEEDFDAKKYDQKMKEVFNHDYYHVDGDDQKPEFPYDPDIDDENWDDYTGQEDEAGPSTSRAHDEDEDYYEPHCEDPDFNMDCDYDETKKSARDEINELSRRKRGRNKKSLFAEKVQAKKPVFDPSQYANYEEYLEEYYKLDFEDIIGDQPVRFKYRTVLANDFGLDTEEILAARDKELNQWCSVKKMSQYRTEEEEAYDLNTFRSRKKDIDHKKKKLPSLFAKNSEDLLVEDQEKDRKKRRKAQGKDENPTPSAFVDDEGLTGANNEPLLQKKKRKNKGKEVLPPADFEALVMQQPEVHEVPETEEVKGKKRKKNRDKSETETNQEPECKKIKAAQSIPTTDESREEAVRSKDSASVKQKKKKERKETPTQEGVISSNNASIVPVSSEPLMSTAQSAKKKAKRNSNSNVISPNAVGAQTVAEGGDASSLKKKKKKKKSAAEVTPNASSTGTDATANKKKKKRKKKKNKGVEISTATQNTGRLSGVAVKKNNISAKKPIKASQEVDIVQSISDDRLKLYGINNPKRFKQAARYGFGKNK